MHTIYGPIPSRRLGQSLGVDPIPFKTCNYNCPYCQLGRTTPLTNLRQSFFSAAKIVAELQTVLDRYQPGDIDYITIVGQGEPALYADLGELIDHIRAVTTIPLAIITNGSLLFMPEVRAAMAKADVVIPSLDGADRETFRLINRPWPKLDINEIIAGQVQFRQEFSGQLWVEVMLVKGVNDTLMALTKIAEALKRIQPDRVHLNIPIRPPAEGWVEPPEAEGLMRAITILSEAAPITTPAPTNFKLTPGMPLTEAIIEIIRRHPMQETELLETLHQLGNLPTQTAEILQHLEATGQARRHQYRDQTFWEYTGSRFGLAVKKGCHSREKSL